MCCQVTSVITECFMFAYISLDTVVARRPSARLDITDNTLMTNAYETLSV